MLFCSNKKEILNKEMVTTFLFIVMSYSVSAGTIVGVITDSSADPLPGVTVGLQNTSKGAITDGNGRYTIEDVTNGSYTLIASLIGYGSTSQTVKINHDGERIDVSLILEESVDELSEVVVYGKSEAQELSEQPIHVSSISAKGFQTKSVETAEILKSITGVQIRREGGLGSNTNVQLNGLQGNAVRVYYDGIPLEYLGGALTLATIPTSLVGTLDIYKGVMPIDKGTDALGGGINIAPRVLDRDFLEASYQVGSFNTHRATLTGVKEISEKGFVRSTSFYNYSDNDYLMKDVTNSIFDTIPDKFGGEPILISAVDTLDFVRRFHNKHQSAFTELEIGWRDLSWAEQFTLFASYSYTYDEDQHGNTVTSKAAGETNRTSNAFISRLKYNKSLLNDKLSLNYHGVFSLSNQKADDASIYEYNWLGILQELDEVQGELTTATALDIDRTNYVHRLDASYDLFANHQLKVSNFYAYSKFVGGDPLGFTIPIAGELIDPNSVPSHLTKNISGLQLDSKWFDEKLTSTVFAKYYTYDAASVDRQVSSATTLLVREVNESLTGYGIALKYLFTESFFIRAGYEDAVRLPTELEIYGNLVSISPNFDIKPERGKNVNLGVTWNYRFDNNFLIVTSANGFVRNTTDLIWRVAFGDDGSKYENNRDTRNIGVETSTRLEPNEHVSLSVNVTYQNLTYQGFSFEDELTGASFIGTPFPNTSPFFYNIQSDLGLRSIRDSWPNFKLYGSYYFTQRFAITDLIAGIANAEGESIVPSQNEINTGISYTTRDKSLSVSLQVNNVTNNFALYDNYRIPKPNRNFNVKILYNL